ncbi:MAG TPA: hypothetical protein VGG10_15285 [Rhizomicrobium sp.]
MDETMLADLGGFGSDPASQAIATWGQNIGNGTPTGNGTVDGALQFLFDPTQWTPGQAAADLRNAITLEGGSENLLGEADTGPSAWPNGVAPLELLQGLDNAITGSPNTPEFQQSADNAIMTLLVVVVLGVLLLQEI